MPVLLEFLETLPSLLRQEPKFSFKEHLTPFAYSVVPKTRTHSELVAVLECYRKTNGHWLSLFKEVGQKPVELANLSQTTPCLDSSEHVQLKERLKSIDELGDQESEGKMNYLAAKLWGICVWHWVYSFAASDGESNPKEIETYPP